MFKKLLLITVGLFCTGLLTAQAQPPAAMMEEPTNTPAVFTETRQDLNNDRFNFSIANPNTVDAKRFMFEIKPGGQSEDFVYLKNASDVPLKFTLYGADGTKTAQGSFALETKGQEQNEVGKWVTFDEKEMVLQPGEAKKVKFRVQAPANTPEGTYSGGVAAEKSSPDTNNPNIIIAVRIALRADVKVTSNPEPIAKMHESLDENPFFQAYFWASLGLFVLSAGALAWSYFKDQGSPNGGKKPKHRGRGTKHSK